MFTYGYIREATMAHLDIDEDEAQAMNLLSRFYIFANEAMQAICSSKPMYKYLEFTVVREYIKLVREIKENGEIDDDVREATREEIDWNVEEQGPANVVFLNDTQIRAYWNERGIYQVGDKVMMPQDFIAFTDRQAYKIVEHKHNYSEDDFDSLVPQWHGAIIREKAIVDDDFSYFGKNQIKFYKAGKYQIPCKCMWYIFKSGISDETEIDMPSDILLTIPLYVASICLQIDTPQKANIKRGEFELALSRCTAVDFMPLNEIKSTW